MTEVLVPPSTTGAESHRAAAAALSGAVSGALRRARVQVQLQPRPVVVTLAGEFDVATAGPLTALLDRLLAVHPDRVVVDMRAVTFIDCAGLEPLLRARSTARVWSGTVALRGASRPVRLLLTALARTRALDGRRGQSLPDRELAG